MRGIIRSPAYAAVLISALSLTCAPAAATPLEDPAVRHLGQLPAGARSGFEFSGAVEEVCRNTYFAPEAVFVTLPAGYRLMQLSDRKETASIKGVLEARPELANHARGTFCILEGSTHTINGKRAHKRPRSKIAFLWADIVPESPGVHSGSDGQSPPPRRAQLFFFYDRDDIDRELALSVNPRAIFARISLVRNRDGWTASVKTEDASVRGEVKASTPRVALRYQTPAYETLLLGDSGSDHHFILTYAGHHERRAVGQWSVSGSARWAQALKSEPDSTKDSFIQDGLAARFGLYPSAGI